MSIWATFLDIVVLLWRLIMPNFVKIPCLIKQSIHELDFDLQFLFQLNTIVVRYRRFRQVSRSLARKGCAHNFKSISQKLRNQFIHRQTDERMIRWTDKRTWLNRLSYPCWSFMYVLFNSRYKLLLVGYKWTFLICYPLSWGLAVKLV